MASAHSLRFITHSLALTLSAAWDAFRFFVSLHYFNLPVSWLASCDAEIKTASVISWHCRDFNSACVIF